MPGITKRFPDNQNYKNWRRFLTSVGLQPDICNCYARILSRNTIKPKMLPYIDKNSLNEMGITSTGEVMEFLRIIKDISGKALEIYWRAVFTTSPISMAPADTDTPPKKKKKRGGKIIRAKNERRMRNMCSRENPAAYHPAMSLLSHSFKNHNFRTSLNPRRIDPSCITMIKEIVHPKSSGSRRSTSVANKRERQLVDKEKRHADKYYIQWLEREMQASERKIKWDEKELRWVERREKDKEEYEIELIRAKEERLRLAHERQRLAFERELHVTGKEFEWVEKKSHTHHNEKHIDQTEMRANDEEDREANEEDRVVVKTEPITENDQLHSEWVDEEIHRYENEKFVHEGEAEADKEEVQVEVVGTEIRMEKDQAELDWAEEESHLHVNEKHVDEMQLQVNDEEKGADEEGEQAVVVRTKRGIGNDQAELDWAKEESHTHENGRHMDQMKIQVNEEEQAVVRKKRRIENDQAELGWAEEEIHTYENKRHVDRIEMQVNYEKKKTNEEEEQAVLKTEFMMKNDQAELDWTEEESLLLLFQPLICCVLNSDMCHEEEESHLHVNENHMNEIEMQLNDEERGANEEEERVVVVKTGFGMENDRAELDWSREKSHPYVNEKHVDKMEMQVNDEEKGADEEEEPTVVIGTETWMENDQAESERHPHVNEKHVGGIEMQVNAEEEEANEAEVQAVVARTKREIGNDQAESDWGKEESHTHENKRHVDEMGLQANDENELAVVVRTELRMEKDQPE